MWCSILDGRLFELGTFVNCRAIGECLYGSGCCYFGDWALTARYDRFVEGAAALCRGLGLASQRSGASLWEGCTMYVKLYTGGVSAFCVPISFRCRGLVGVAFVLLF